MGTTKSNLSSFRGLWVSVVAVAVLCFAANTVSSNERIEESYSIFIEQLNKSVRAAIQNSRRVPQEEVEHHLESFFSEVTRDSESMDPEKAKWLLRAAEDAAGVTPDLVDGIPELARQIQTARNGGQVEPSPHKQESSLLASILEDGLWRLINAREFVHAEEFAREHRIEFPKWFDGWRPPEKVGPPMYLAFDSDDRAVHPAAHFVDLRRGSWLIVEVHPDCGPSRKAMSYLSDHHDVLSAVPKDRVVFVVSQSAGQALPSLVEWNQDNPATKMVLSYRNEEWPDGITFFQTPVFNFVRDGEVVDKLIGWPSDKQANALRQNASEFLPARFKHQAD